MLDQKDLQALKGMMETVVDTRLSKSENMILSEVDTRLSESENTILSEVDTKLSKSENMILSEVDARLSKSENAILSKIDTRLSESENMILAEMDRMQERIEARIKKVDLNLEETKQYYRTNKFEQESAIMLLEMIKSLQKDVDDLKRKIA